MLRSIASINTNVKLCTKLGNQIQSTVKRLYARTIGLHPGEAMMVQYMQISNHDEPPNEHEGQTHQSCESMPTRHLIKVKAVS